MKLGFIGCGVISTAHLEGLQQLKNEGKKTFDLTAVCDLRQDRAEEFAAEVERRLGKRPEVYTDYRRMLEEGRLDAVSVLLDHDLHHTVAEIVLPQEYMCKCKSRWLFRLPLDGRCLRMRKSTARL